MPREAAGECRMASVGSRPQPAIAEIGSNRRFRVEPNLADADDGNLVKQAGALTTYVSLLRLDK